MKIGIVTWVTYHNYGTFLQAYALQQALRNLGHEAQLISDKRQIRSYLSLMRGKLATMLYPIYKRLKSLRDPHCRAMRRLEREYDDFAQRHLDIFDWKWPDQLDARFDMFVTGSDQIWSPIAWPLTEELKAIYGHYFLNFTDKPKISYAPSVKIDQNLSEVGKMIGPWLDRYTAISVREEYGAEKLRQITSQPVDVVLDPTLLLTADDWHRITSGADKERYARNYLGGVEVRCYFLRFNQAYVDRVREFAASVNLPVKIISPLPDYDGIEGIEHIMPDPEGFVEAVSTARYMFTDSFHGSVFSIIFGVPVMGFENEQPGAVNGRLANIYDRLGIGHRLQVASRRGPVTQAEMDDIDFESVHAKLETERQQSLDWLKQSLEICKR